MTIQRQTISKLAEDLNIDESRSATPRVGWNSLPILGRFFDGRRKSIARVAFGSIKLNVVFNRFGFVAGELRFADLA
jgi:hypothetical protein